MRVTRKILIPFIASFMLVLALLIGLIIAYANISLETQEASNLDLLRQSFNNATDAQKQLALSLATQLADNPDVQAAFAAGDRQRLIDLTLPAYKTLAKQYGVSQAQFHLPPATSFLRLHQLDKFGDDLSKFRFTVLAANQQHQPIAGLEIGRAGIGVRGVVPVTYQDHSVGTVEFGLDPGLATLENLKQQYGVDWQILLSREPAKIGTFQPVTGTAESPLPDLLLQASTMTQPVFTSVDTYQQALQGHDATYRTVINGRSIVILSAPLRDYSNQVIGVIDIVHDRTEIVQLLAGRMLAVIIALIVVMVLGTLISAVVATRALRPIGVLTETTTAIASGDLNRTAPVQSQDEIGQLAQSFNTMTARLRDTIDSLETRVEMRTAQVQASADVGRVVTSILDPDQLLKRVVQLITERFGFYYAAAFTLDSAGQWAVLREAAGPNNAAWLLKQAGHRLEITGNSMVAASIRDRQARIALDVGAEAIRFSNPLLPETRSEVALPLIVGDQVLGALDVQSMQAAAFDETSTAVLQNMADQIAIALNNAAQYQLEQQRAQQTTQLLEASVELSSQTDATSLYNRIIEVAANLLHADSAALWQPVEENEIELLYATGPLKALIGQRAPIGEGIAGRVHASSLALRLNDTRTWRDAAVDFGEVPVQAVVAVPMVWQGEPVGVLVVAHTYPDSIFTADDGNVAQLYAAQTASTLANMRLLEQLQSTLNDLGAANRRLTGEAWQAHLRGSEISYEYRRTTASPTRSAQPALSLALPIELRGQPIGQIILEDDRPQRELTEDERSIVQEVTQRMSLALESARLFEQTQAALGEARRLAQREQLINRITGQLRATTTVDEVLQIATAEMRRAVKASWATVKLTPPTDGDDGQGDRS